MAFDGTIPIRFRTRLVVGADVVEEDVLAEAVVVFAMVMKIRMLAIRDGFGVVSSGVDFEFTQNDAVKSTEGQRFQNELFLTWQRRYGRWRRSRIIS